MDGNKEEILALQQELTDRMKQNRFADTEALFTDDVTICCSTTGTGTGREAAGRLLAYPGPTAYRIKQNVENSILRYNNKEARQSFHLHMLYALYDEAKEFHYLQYGGSFILAYQKRSEGWRISEVLFDLCWIEGNSYWVHHWKLTACRIPPQPKPVIGVNHGVHRQIPAAKKSDAEQIAEILFQYGWVIDREDYELLQEIAVSDLVVNDGYQGKTMLGRQAWADYIKNLNEQEPCRHHTFRIKEITVSGITAGCRMSRLEPNRIGSRAIGSHNYFIDWLTLDYQVQLIKMAGSWKIKTVEFRKNIRPVPAAGFQTGGKSLWL